MKDPMEVSPLARGVMLLARNPYPFHYKTAFASSIIPYPAFHRLALRFAVPEGERRA